MAGDCLTEERRLMRTPCKPNCVCVRCVKAGKADWNRRQAAFSFKTGPPTPAEIYLARYCPHDPPCLAPGGWICQRKAECEALIKAERDRLGPAGGA